MGRYAKESGGGDFQQAPPGTHVARCIKLIDLGTQHGEYEGKPTVREQVVVQWELPGETIDTDKGAQPMIVSKFYTNSLSEKATLRADLEAWRGRQFTPDELASFDLEKILGAPCLVNVIHSDKGKARVKGVMSLPKGTICPPAHNTPSAFWLDPWDYNAYMSLSEGFRNIIVESDEVKDMVGGSATISPAARDAPDDDIPF